MRTRFKKDIVAEFLPSTKPSSKVIIICGGMPGAPKQEALLSFITRYSKKDYWVFYPRYRGSWESGGQFLHREPTDDIRDVINELPHGFTNLWNNKRYRVRPTEIILFASSFGGPAGILLSKDPRVTKVIAISPVVDWRDPSKDEPLAWLGKVVPKVYGNAYRYTMRDWNKLKTGRFYNPATRINDIDGSKILMVHAKDDGSVGYPAVARFAKKIGATLITRQHGGHLGFSFVVHNKSLFKKISNFLRS